MYSLHLWKVRNYFQDVLKASVSFSSQNQSLQHKTKPNAKLKEMF